MNNAIAIDNDSLRMGEATRTLTGDHESRVTDTGTSIVQTFCKTGHAVNAQGDGEKYASSSSSSTLNTFENHTDGRAVGIVVSPAVCKTLSAEGFDGMPDIQKGNGQPSALEPTVAVGCDRRNQSGADEVQPALQSTVSDGGSTVAVGINSPQPHSTTRGFGEDVQPTFGAAAGESGNNKPMVALNHIVRRLTPTEAERLQGFPDGWTRIPYRGRPADECPDSPRYKALGNSFATNCCEYVLRRIVAAFRLDMIPETDA